MLTRTVPLGWGMSSHTPKWLTGGENNVKKKLQILSMEDDSISILAMYISGYKKIKRESKESAT